MRAQGHVVASELHTWNLRRIWGEPPPLDRTPRPLAGGTRDRFENDSSEYPNTTVPSRAQSAAVAA